MTLAEFKKHDAEVGMPQSMHSVTDLDCRDGRTWSSIASGRTASVFGHPVKPHASPPRITATDHRHGSDIGDGDCERDPLSESLQS